MARTRRTPKRKRVVVKYLQMFLVGIFFLALVFMIGQRMFIFVKRLQIFQIREVVIAPNLSFIDTKDFSGLKGLSIFDVPLKKIQERLRSRYPQADQLRIVRGFPDTLYVIAKKRDPFIVLASDSERIVLDQDGVVLAAGLESTQNLPTVTGVADILNVSPGRVLQNRTVRVALEIIKATHGNKGLTAFPVDTIDVMNLSRIQVTLKNGLKVIFDQERIAPKVDQLAFILAQPDVSLSNVEYIDLRFREPLLGQKDLPKKNKR